jgi:hypothetical protein
MLADVPLQESYELMEQDVDSEIPPPDPSKKIDLEDPYGEKAEEEQAKAKEKEEKNQEKLKLAAAPETTKPFPTIAGLDPTGRDESVEAYKKTSDAIIRTYRKLHNQEDQRIFKDYLITNILLYLDKYEGDISSELPDITTPEYEKQKADIARFSKQPEAPAEQAPAPQQGGEEKLAEQILNSLKKLNIV